MTIPRIIDVRITHNDDDPKYVVVSAVWAGVDRPISHGWSVTKGNAQRLERALRAGVVYENPVIKTDIGGSTYVSARSRVMAKYVNADLKKLGY